MSEPTLILQNMRGGCATVGETVHTLFRFKGHRPVRTGRNETAPTIKAADITEAIEMMNTRVEG